MNLLIVGVGQIGRSHLKSFYLSKKKYNIYLYDINHINKKIINKKKIYNFNILKKFPKNLNFDLCIVSTNSLERYSIINKLVKYNKIKYFIFEKYIFTKKQHYSSMRKILFKLSSRSFINLWGSIVADSLNLKFKNKTLRFNASIKNGRFITNVIHFLDLFCFLTSRNLVDLKIDIKKIINSKRKKYKEIVGSMFAKNNQGTIKIASLKNITHDNIKIEDGGDIYKIIIAKNKKCILYKNSKIINKVAFPYAYENTANIFEKYLIKKKKKKIYFNFKSNFIISESIIKKISHKKIYIT